MNERMTYTATAERDGRFWFIQIEGVGATQARRLDQAEEMARDLVSLKLGVPAGSFDVDVRPTLDSTTSELVVRAAVSTGRARVQQLEASLAQREAALALERGGLTVRDMGRVLGLSHQRVAQLLADRGEPEELRQRLQRELSAADDPRTRVYERRAAAGA